MKTKVKTAFKPFIPPALWDIVGKFWRRANLVRASDSLRFGEQSLKDYWDPTVAQILETWGEDSVWIEIQLLLADRRGKVLDIACGSGRVMRLLERFSAIEVHGFDISDMLIERAVGRGIPRQRLRVYDATRTEYADHSFEFAYSIGSLEHFTNDGITAFLRECKRIVKEISFHQIPISADNKDHGWIRTFQSYHNNSVGWWLAHFNSVFDNVQVLDSTWNDSLSRGKWFICKP